ncbi:MAG: hypothetical protein KY458_09430 [Actinobacteria bacterium]|nr:hypothetical protein [Actinomycetota bacterium]
MRRLLLAASLAAMVALVGTASPAGAGFGDRKKPGPVPGGGGGSNGGGGGGSASGTLPNGGYRVSIGGGQLSVFVGGGAGSPGAGAGLPNDGDSCRGGDTFRYQTIGRDEAERLRREWGVAHSGAFVRLYCGDAAEGEFFRPDSAPEGPTGLYSRDRHAIALNSPEVHTSPSRDQLVHVKTWLWIDSARFTTQRTSATFVDPATGEPYTVTATATPTRAVWEMGDGREQICTDAGTPYDRSVPADRQDTTCSHTYRRSSAAQPDQVFAGRVTSYFHVQVFVNGVLDKEFDSPGWTAPFARRVGEGQAVGTRAG